MRLARFAIDGRIALGKVTGDRIVDLGPLAPHGSMRQLLADLPLLRGAIADASEPSLPLDAVRLEAPIADPQKVLAIGMNYQAHADEAEQAGIPRPTSQLWFNKQVSCLNGPFSDVVYPAVSTQLDYEVELAFVIGKRCRHVRAADAASVIAGYMCANDVSARDWQLRSQTMTLGKSFDTHGPIGPWIVTADEIADPHDLDIRLTVNGELRQHANTSDLIYDIFEQVAYLSTVMTLEPGDVILTGTPAGIGMTSGKLLKIGDVVRIEIDGIGAIENRIVADPAT